MGGVQSERKRWRDVSKLLGIKKKRVPNRIEKMVVGGGEGLRDNKRAKLILT